VAAFGRGGIKIAIFTLRAIRVKIDGRAAMHSPGAGGSSPMKDIFEILRQKEAELQVLQQEVEALRLAAKLVADGGHPAETMIHALRSEKAMPPARSAKAMAPVQAGPEAVSKDFSAGSALLRQFP
jgi:hypothetical protein